MKNGPSKVMSADVYRVVEDARDAELCRNLDRFRGILAAFWDDIESEPDVSRFEPGVQAELLRLCGVFLSQYGRARGLNDHQLHAKDLLSRAGELFETEGLPEKAAETKVSLANCYWFAGEVAEYDDILRSVEEEFGAEPSHPVAIQIKLNRIIVAAWRRECEEARRLVEEVDSVISEKHDLRLRTQFHNLAGISARAAGDFERSEYHAKESVRIAREAGNRMFLAMNLNNLAFVYRVTGAFEKATATIDEAIAIMDGRGDRGWAAHALDTKALIFLDQGRCDDTLEAIGRAIDIFSEGEDYSGLADAMWTKCTCLLRLGRVSEALIIFADLKEIAARQIGEVAVNKFASLFAEEVHAIKHIPLSDEVAAFKRSRVIRAMQQTAGHVGDAAKVLGLKSQQHLSDILNNQFPDIYEELGLKRRARRSDAAVPRRPDAAPPGVTRLIMPKNRTYAFNFAFSGGDPDFYYFPRDMMKKFGVRSDGVVAVIPVKPDAVSDGEPVLYMRDDSFKVGRLSFDALSGLYLVDLEDLTFLSDVQLLGVTVGFCPVAKRNEKLMKFEPLRLVDRD
jgi:tetratricopeptide (TPR) repeat protein